MQGNLQLSWLTPITYQGNDIKIASSQHHCGLLHVCINGRTLIAALTHTKAPHTFGVINKTQWISVCPACHTQLLGSETNHPWPFVCADGVMRTVNDFQLTTGQFHSQNLDFCGFQFSRSALESAILLARAEFAITDEVEKLRAQLSAGVFNDVLKFSEEVCNWGQGQRVWGNLIRFNESSNLERQLRTWFTEIAYASDEDAILKGTQIRGLDVSFASKHLRMLHPKKYAVLDSVLSNGLGFALNSKGYRFFLSMLRRFAFDHAVTVCLAELEAGIFLLVRQHVRSKTSDLRSQL